MTGIDLELITTATADENSYKISGIPEKLWQVFKEAAKFEMPEKGELAWASVLTEIIQKHVVGDVYTYIMTDIPTEAKEAFERAANQADMTTDHIIAVMFKQAGEGKLHLLNMITEEGAEHGYRVLVIAGLSDIAWEKWRTTAATVDLAPEELIGSMFEAAAGGNLQLTRTPSDPHNYNYKEHKNGRPNNPNKRPN